MIRELLVKLIFAFALLSGGYLSEEKSQVTLDLTQVQQTHDESVVAGYLVKQLLRLPNNLPVRFIAKTSNPRDKKSSMVVAERSRIWLYDAGASAFEEVKKLGAGIDRPYIKAFTIDEQSRIWILDAGYPAFFDGHWHRLKRPDLNTSFVLQSSVLEKSGLILKELFPLRAIFPAKFGKVFLIRDDVIGAYDAEQWSEISAPPPDLESKYFQLELPKHHNQPVQTLRERQDWEMKQTTAPRELINQLLRSKPISILSETYCGLVDRAGYLLLGANRAIFRVDLGTNQWNMYPLPSGLAQAAVCYESRSGRLWFSDLFGGIAAFDRHANNWVTYNILNSLPESERPKPITLSPRERRLIDYNQRSGTPDELLIETSPSLRANSIYEDRDGCLLFATDSGLVVFNPERKDWSLFTAQNSPLPSNRINIITEDQRGMIWVGTDKGIVILSK